MPRNLQSKSTRNAQPPADPFQRLAAQGVWPDLAKKIPGRPDPRSEWAEIGGIVPMGWKMKNSGKLNPEISDQSMHWFAPQRDRDAP
jgi:hypothetical protein